MINIEELKEVGKMLGLKNIGYTEKNYFHHLILLSISREENKLIFKGGTCLSLCYGLDRFSEDLDFSAKGKININKLTETIKNYLSKFGAELEVKKIKESGKTILIDLSIRGILYKGTRESLCNIKIDIGKLPVFLKTKIIFLHPTYTEIPTYSLEAMNEEEILAEKIGVLFLRTSARDLYDIWFLLRKGTKVNSDLVKKKLGKKVNKLELEERIGLFENIWDELKSFVQYLPDFKSVKKDIKKIVL